MSDITRCAAGFAVLLACANAQETACPVYPASSRVDAERAIGFDRQVEILRRTNAARRTPTVQPASKNLIDDWTFKKMKEDGVDAAPLTTDAEFVRRIYLDLTGRIPTFEQTKAFLSDTSADKRDRLIDALLASSSYVDQFSFWLRKRFQVVRGNLGGDINIGIPERNNFYNFVRSFVEQDRAYDAFAREIITAAGDTDTAPATAPLSRQVTEYYASAVQDFWDNFTDLSTAQFLGFHTSCVSCHNGRGHLEKINLFLAPVRRSQFWQLSAFFSRTRVQVVIDDASANRRRLIFSDAASGGGYNGIVNPAAPGPRPSRNGANATPEYWFTGETPQSDGWRAEWARVLTSDPQFALAGANYLWAYFFGSGIVDPPDGWDLARVDPANPPPADWPIQISHPELLKELASRFKSSGYSFKSVIRLIVSSNTYQLASRYSGKWQPAYARYFARHEAQRLTAEQMFDSLGTATGTEAIMEVDGLPGQFRYANQLPHPHSTLDSAVDSLLTSLGQGNWLNQSPSNQPSLYGILDFFNNWNVAARTRAWSDSTSPQSRLAVWVGSGLSDTEVINNIFLATLSRAPSDAEVAAIRGKKQSNRLLWLTAVQWAVLQKSDFVFNY